jgi:KUP system potassium uptake protein
MLKLSYCPQVKVVHTSKTFHGQLYVPFLNWLLLVGTILVTAVYRDTTRLGNAYGTAVMFVVFFDTCMIALVALIVWRLSPWIIAFPFLFFACFEGLYLSSALTKVPDGAWFTLTISGILASIFLLWRYGKESQWKAEAEDRFPLATLVKRDTDEGMGSTASSMVNSMTTTDGLRLRNKWGGDAVSRIRGFGIYFDKTGDMTPMVFTQFVTKFVAATEVVVFFHLHPVEVPTVPDEERYIVTHFREIPGCYRLVIRHGFMDEVISPDLAVLVYEQIRKFVIRQASTANINNNIVTPVSPAATIALDDSGLPMPAAATRKDNGTATETPATQATTPETEEDIELQDEKVAAELGRLDRAYNAKTMYVIGKEQMRVRDNSPLWRKLILSVFLWIRENTRAKIANLRLAADRVVEVGFVKEI